MAISNKQKSVINVFKNNGIALILLNVDFFFYLKNIINFLNIKNTARIIKKNPTR